MPTGTITLKNNSSAVTGSGTAFSTELKANDFIVVTVGQTVYTLGVKSVESNTALTLVRNFDGPSAGGLAWTPIPYGTMVTITAQTHAYTAEALRGLLLDKQNWQQLFSGTGNITVTLPDGSSFTGPAWNSITASLNNKLDKTVATAQEIKSSLSLQGSLITGKDANLDVGGFSRFRKSATFDDTIWAPKGVTCLGAIGDSTPAVSVECKYNGNTGTWGGASIFSRLTVQGVTKVMMMSCRQEIGVMDYGLLSYKDWMGRWHEVRLENTGNMNNLTGGWTTGSDSRIKTDIKKIDDPISLVRDLKLYSFKRDGKSMIGGIAQEIEKKLPHVVSEGGSLQLQNGELVDRVKSVDYSTLGYVAIAALNQALDRIDRQDEIIKKLMEKLQ